MIVWREKYRPNKIDDLAGCKEFKEAAKSWLAKGSLPANMLYVGPPGVGKTSAAYALAKEMYGDYFDPSNFIVTNASDERGIDFVRELKHMAKQKGIGVRRRIFVLDEADSLTPAAQKALRQVMEDSHRTAIFILTANDISPIHKAIRDRCLTFRFKPLSDEEAREKLLEIHTAENLPIPWREQYTMLNRLTNGSLRQSIDILEGKKFFMKFYNHPCDKVAIENPISLRVFNMPEFSQEIQPYEYGHPFSKKTRLWLKGLPNLKPTNIIYKKM